MCVPTVAELSVQTDKTSLTWLMLRSREVRALTPTPVLSLTVKVKPPQRPVVVYDVLTASFTEGAVC